MKKKRICALLLTVAMTAGTLAGCGGDSGSGSTETGSAATEEGSSDSASGDVIELTFFNADANQDDPWTDPVALAITEKTGVKLKTTRPVGGNDESEAVALMIAEQNYPDIIFAKGSSGNLIDADAMMDMTDLIEEYGPNIKKLYGEEFEKLKQSADDPSIYQLSAYMVGGTKFKDVGNIQIQWAALKAKDYKIPESLEELETMIKDYIAENPKTDDGLDKIGISLSTSDWHWLIRWVIRLVLSRTARRTTDSGLLPRKTRVCINSVPTRRESISDGCAVCTTRESLTPSLRPRPTRTISRRLLPDVW